MMGKARPAILLLTILLGVACGSPQENALEQRRLYGVEVKTREFKEVAANPLAAAANAAGDTSAHALQTDALSAAADDPAGALVIPEAPDGPRRVEVGFGLLVTRQSGEGLPGITFDVTQTDPFKQLKKTYRKYVELPKAFAGQAEQVYFSIVADDFVDGDAFAVLIRPDVPEAERGEYRELQPK
jgi:hypothetical protein